MRVCLVSPTLYPLLVPGVSETAGGAELQLLLLGRALRRLGHEISMVVGDYGQEPLVQIEGFEIHRCFKPGAGNRKLSFPFDMLSLRSAIKRARPDVVNQRSTSFYTGQCCRFAHEANAAFVFWLGIDYNCYPNLLGRAPWPIQWMYRWGLEHAEGIVTQTAEQGALIRSNFGLNSQLIPNLVASMDTEVRGSAREHFVLWVGSLARRKRPELIMEIAEICPDIEFKIVGGVGEDAGHAEYIRERATARSNIEFVGFVPPSEIGNWYERARLYLNTSELEGLPNTYLEAWSRGTPCVSLGVDPDGVIAREGLGTVGADTQASAAAIRALLSDAAEWSKTSERCRAYVRREHDPEVLGRRAESYLAGALRIVRTSAGEM